VPKKVARHHVYVIELDPAVLKHAKFAPPIRISGSSPVIPTYSGACLNPDWDGGAEFGMLEHRGIELDHVNVVSRDFLRHEGPSSVWRSAARALR